jgi:glycerol uptake facilitator-like aquaporin
MVNACRAYFRWTARRTDPGHGPVTTRVHTGRVHRVLGFAAVVAGIMTFLALGAASLLSAPMAIAFAVTAFWWNLTRPGGATMAPAVALGPCRGCRRGCVECRERIDA